MSAFASLTILIIIIADDFNLTIGQLAWLDNDILLAGMRPLLLSNAMKSEAEVTSLLENAYHDLYYTDKKPATRLYVVHAIKKEQINV